MSDILTWRERAPEFLRTNRESLKHLPMTARLALARSECIAAEIKELRERIEDHQESDESKRRLIRDMDVTMNGDKAAKQASLCDIAMQLRSFMEWRDKMINASRNVTSSLYCMSYNDSYFGEPAGKFKAQVAELNRLLPVQSIKAWRPIAGPEVGMLVPQTPSETTEQWLDKAIQPKEGKTYADVCYVVTQKDPDEQ
jgi:hypothetical protein